ncbi:MAG: DUF4190 domain-containing protein [Planctomycetota bacterium]|jgi:hypothetical protein
MTDPPREPSEYYDAEETDATGGVIPYKNSPALILGILGLKRVRQRPAVRGTVHAWIGIILGGLCGLTWLVVTVVLLVTM